MAYPATNTNDASKLLIDVSNQVHEVVNGTSEETVTTESGEIPALRKAITDTFLFQEPIAWSQGSDETVFNQLRTFNNETYWAPTATLSSPVPMGTTPVGDSNWKIAPVGSNNNVIQGWDNQSQEELVKGKIYPEIGTLSNGDTVPSGTTHLRVLIGGESTIVAMSPVSSGIVGTITDTTVDIGATTVKIIPHAISVSYEEATISQLIEAYGVGAWAAAAAYKKLVIDINVSKSGTYVIPSNQTIEFLATVSQTDNLTAFQATGSFWQLTGNGKIARSAGIPSAFISGSRGLSITSTAFRWSISGKLRIEHFAGSGLIVDGSSIITGGVSESSIEGLTCHQNANNYQFLAGFAAEYISITNAFSTEATVKGLYLESANVTWAGGAITRNKAGIHLKHPTSGANPHHGMFTGVNINHNINYQLFADGVALGYDFVGCHFYDNGNPATGRIQLSNCRGINISGGTLGCYIEYVDTGGPHVGYNRISGNKAEAAAAIVTGAGFDRTKLIITDNFDINGSWLYNDDHKVNYLSRSTVDSNLPASVISAVYKLDTVFDDNRSAVTGATFRPPWSSEYTWLASLDFDSTSEMTNTWLNVVRDDTASGVFETLAVIPVIPISETKAYCNGTFKFPATANGQLGFRLQSSSNLNVNGGILKAGSTIQIYSDN